jgi:hypothetical protein
LHGSNRELLMSALGQKQTSDCRPLISALPPKADISSGLPPHFDRRALADIKRFVNKVSLPADEEFPPQMDAFWEAAARPALGARASKAFEDGLQQRSDVELRLGAYVGQFG